MHFTVAPQHLNSGYTIYMLCSVYVVLQHVHRDVLVLNVAGSFKVDFHFEGLYLLLVPALILVLCILSIFQ